MGKVGVNSSCPVAKEHGELNCHIEDESKEIRDGVMGEGQGLSKEDEFQVNDDVQDVNDGRPEAVQAEVLTQTGQQRSEQQPQGPSVCWEEFLSVRSLKVLLVETDYSTRQVVTALLRNCGYEVIAVANGIQAWKILKDLTTCVDLVLSEVVMPSLSGIDLLTKIMGHKTCKNIPVIMMSSYNSMSTVLKCLSNGAVDFLVKPIRKNELKNLWQHVWRKGHNQSSGSASESGVPTETSTKSTSAEESEKNTGSNYGDKIGSFGLDEESRRGDDEFPKHSLDLFFQITQVTHSRSEAFDNDGVPPIKTRECEGEHEELDVVMGKDLGIGTPGIPNFQLEEPKEKGLSKIASTNKDNEQLQKGQPELNNEKPNWELKNQAIDLIGVTTTSSADPQMESVLFDIRNGISKIPDIKDKAIHDNKEIPSLKLSLKTQRDVCDTGFSDHDRYVWRPSNHSAFARYKSPTTSKQAPSGNLGSYSPLDNSTQEAKAKSLQNFQSNSNSTSLYQRSDGSSSNNDMGSTMNNFFTNEKACEDKPEHNRIISLSKPMIQGKADAAVCNTTLSQGKGMNHQVQVQHQHQHMHNVPQHQHQQIPNHDHWPLKNMAAAAPKCGSSNVQDVPMEGNVGNHSLHWSASGSNHSSNPLTGDCSAINSRGTDMESDEGVVGEEGTVSAVGDGSKSGVDQNHLSQREAALHKFCQKRKERCFERKVRYQSRQKLAEQRPRVCGQFVQQAVHENKGNDTHS